MNEFRSIAEAYHHLTVYDEESVRQGPGLNWSTQPPQFKEIISEQRVPLRGMLMAGEDSPLAQLSRLLFHANGATGIIRYPGGERQVLRAAPSAGALYPTEVYVACGEQEGLDAGLYNFQVSNHELVRLWDGDQRAELAAACGGGLEACPFLLVFTGYFWRSAWRYRERGYRRVLLDTGHVLANVTAYAEHERCTTDLRLGFVDADLNAPFFFDANVEATLACIGIREGAGTSATGPLWPSGTKPGGHYEAAVIEEKDDLKVSMTAALHGGSVCEQEAAPAPGRGETPLSDRSLRLEAPIDIALEIPRAIQQRRSARGYSGGAIDLPALGHALGFALGRADVPRCATRTGGLMRAHVTAIDVAGLDPGLYAVEAAGEALLPLELGNLREKLFSVSLGQEIARTCAAALILSARARDAVESLGERAYRYLHLEAGIIGERFQLAAGAQGLAACGIGGFLDRDVAAMVGLEPEDWVLYLITAGKTGVRESR